jgi:hypothetical protein
MLLASRRDCCESSEQKCMMRSARRRVLLGRVLLALVTVLLHRVYYASANAVPQTDLNFRTVNSVTLLQRAINEGVRHVVLTEHVQALEAQAALEGDGRSLNTAIGILKPTTKSFVVRLTSSSVSMYLPHCDLMWLGPSHREATPRGRRFCGVKSIDVHAMNTNVSAGQLYEPTAGHDKAESTAATGSLCDRSEGRFPRHAAGQSRALAA